MELMGKQNEMRADDHILTDGMDITGHRRLSRRRNTMVEDGMAYESLRLDMGEPFG